MPHRSCSLVIIILAASLSAQQAPPSPAPQLDRLKPLVGQWQGSGTADMHPGAPPAKWTCASTYAFALGGFWLQCDTSIEFEGMPQGMRFREYLGWDVETGRYVNVTASNTGEVTLAPVVFTADDTMVLAISRIAEGAPQLERSVTRIGKDEMSFTITFVNGAEPAHEGVKGTLKRVAKAAPKALESCGAFMPAAAEMARLARMGAEYDVRGQMVMMPGQPAMKIQGRDSVTSLFDGGIVRVLTTGTAEGMPGKYEAAVYYAWDPAQKCYIGVMVSNMGEVGQTQARFVGDDKFVATFAGTMQGTPMVNSTVLQLDADGKARHVTSHCISGAEPPFEGFRADYEVVR